MSNLLHCPDRYAGQLRALHQICEALHLSRSSTSSGRQTPCTLKINVKVHPVHKGDVNAATCGRSGRRCNKHVRGHTWNCIAIPEREGCTSEVVGVPSPRLLLTSVGLHQGAKGFAGRRRTARKFEIVCYGTKHGQVGNLQ